MVDETPSPASYHIPRRPLNERNAPVFTIGKRCFVEKGGGGRVSWEKEWFNSRNPHTHKSDFRRELFWPTPTNYRIRSVMSKENIHYNLYFMLVLVYVSFLFSFIYIYKCRVTTIILFEVFLVCLKSSCVSINILFTFQL